MSTIPARALTPIQKRKDNRNTRMIRRRFTNIPRTISNTGDHFTIRATQPRASCIPPTRFMAPHKPSTPRLGSTKRTTRLTY
jgi:hypothetical protein